MSGAVFIALFSGINVGGKRIVKMAALTALLSELGFDDIATYVQSGNAVFRAGGTDARALAGRIESAFSDSFGFTSRVIVRDRAGLADVVAHNPFAEIVGEPTRLHAVLLERSPTSDEIEALAARDPGTDRWQVVGDTLYLRTPEGIGKSRFAAALPRALKVHGTARNWRTVLALLAMAESA